MPIPVLRQLRAYRQRRGLTQAQLGARVGVTPEFISMLETGKRRGDSWMLLQKLSHALGITPNLLLADQLEIEEDEGPIRDAHSSSG